MAHWYLL